MLRNVWNRVFSKRNVVLKGTDAMGNKYFCEITETGTERRWFESPTGEHYPQLPAEWHSWLHHRREVAPTAQLSAQLEKIREQTRKNAQLWEEEMAQLNMRSGLNDTSSVQRQGFEEIVQLMQNADSDTSETTIIQRTPSGNHPPPSSSNDTLQTSDNTASDLTTDNSEVRGLAPRKSVDDAYHPSTHKAVDTTDMSAEELRDTLRAYSMSRTSRFLGVKPQMRSEARDALNQQQQNDSKPKKNDEE
jgi:NADH:ubiquinone oxidoreductase subunit